MSKVKLRFIEIIVLLKFFAACFLTLGRKQKDLWIISERGHEARDNGFAFFEYIKKSHKHINVKYIIDAESKDYSKFDKYPNSVIKYGTFEHYIVLCKSSVLVSTHIMGYTPFMDFFVKLDRKYRIFRFKKQVFLQHGIIKDFLPSLMKNSINVDLFCCGAKPEYEYILANFGFSEKTVKYTGLCRYDKLNDYCSKKQILVMPTWRMYERDKNFTSTAYFIHWSAFLESKHLHSLLEKYEYELVFYPHYEVQRHIQCFNSLELSSHIRIADFSYDVQTLLKESCMLITDYSSVYFDMAYMRKPIVFYQFDEEEFRSKHYQRGYLREETLGYKCNTQVMLLAALENLCKNGMNVERKYKDIADSFFELRDSKNCERVYNAIINC